MKTFIDLCLEEKTKPKDIYNFIHKWHDNNGFGIKIYDYLGITRKEYNLFCDDGDNLLRIIDGYKRKMGYKQKIIKIKDIKPKDLETAAKLKNKRFK